MPEECDDSGEDIKQAYNAILSLVDGTVKYVQEPGTDLPDGIAEILADWPGIADDEHWKNHPQFRAHIERGKHEGVGKWVRRQGKRVFIKDFTKYGFSKEKRCWRANRPSG